VLTVDWSSTIIIVLELGRDILYSVVAVVTVYNAITVGAVMQAAGTGHHYYHSWQHNIFVVVVVLASSLRMNSCAQFKAN